MKASDHKSKRPEQSPGLTPKQKGNEEKDNLSGYPEYPDNEDIYNQYHEESDINPEDTTKKKEWNTFDNKNGDIDLNDMSGNDIDVPGGELDDDQENIGSEDEENNYYSLGEDNYDDREEEKNDDQV